MKPPPLQIDGARVVAYTPIDDRHRPTGRTKQIVGGREVGPAAGLAICQYENDPAFYLFGCDVNWKGVTDTWHQSIEEARDQAEFEYEGSSQTWVYGQ
jgi:hypothetical protein